MIKPGAERAVKQSRLMSLVEALANVVGGYGLAVATQLLVFPLFGLPADFDVAVAIGAIFTVISIARSFLLRRLFETFRVQVTTKVIPGEPTFPGGITPEKEQKA